MPASDPRTQAFFEKPDWQAELAALRAIVLSLPLEETFKWRGPCYTAHGGNIATLWRFKDACGIGLFKGVLAEDPKGLLVALGENSRSMRAVKFTDLAAVRDAEPALRALITSAIAVEKAGLKVDMPKDDLEMPEELLARLEEDPVLQTAFDALTPGRRRSHILHVAGARQSATRAARVEKCRPKILAGRGFLDR